MIYMEMCMLNHSRTETCKPQWTLHCCGRFPHSTP